MYDLFTLIQVIYRETKKKDLDTGVAEATPVLSLWNSQTKNDPPLEWIMR